MSYSSYSPLKFVEDLSFIRYGGTPAEKKAAEMILAEVEASGGKGEIMEFQINASDYKSHVTRIVAPYEQDLNTVAFGMCGSIPAPGKDLKVLYAERATDMDLLGYDDLSEYVVMVDQLSLDAYKAIVKRNAAAIFVIMGKYYNNNDEAGLYNRNLRPKQLEIGVVPTFAINAHEATDLLRNGAQTIHVELDQTDGKATSRDVLAVIEGTEKPQESIVIVGHYDSLPIGPGAWDNATGSAALMGLYKYFLENPPKRTLRFVWCGSEEQGLLGSKEYIEQHEDLIPSIKFCFNFDMCGTILGPNGVFVTGDKKLENYVDLFCREVGYSANVHSGVHSSDSAPFADRGIPALGISRGTRSSEIHTSRDTTFPLGEAQLKMNIDFASKIITRVANSVVLPADVGMPDEMKKELDKYFQREPAKK